MNISCTIRALSAFLLFWWHGPCQAQPETHDAGAFILQIYVKNDLYKCVNGKWLNQSRQTAFADEELKIRHFVLNKKLGQKKEIVEPIDPSTFDVFDAPDMYAVFLPPGLKGKPTPNQSLELVCAQDTMRIDFIGVPYQHMYVPAQLLAIHFNPGHYTYRFAGDQALMPKKQEDVEQLNKAMKLGITPESEPILVRHGMLSYQPPMDARICWKYIAPQIRIEQRTPFSAMIRLKGTFMGRVTQEYISEKVINLFYTLEVLQDAQWITYLHGPGMEANEEGLKIDALFMRDQAFQQFISVDAPPGMGMGIPTGTYRISVKSDDNHILTSQAFTLGMAEPNPDKPYQILFRDVESIPHFTLDDLKDIHIETSFKPLMQQVGSGTEQVYHFQYFDGLDASPFARAVDPEDRYTRELNVAVRAKKLYINGTPFTGKVKYAFSNSGFSGNQMKLSWDVIIVQYQNGTCLSHEILHDVDPLTEESPERHY